MSSSAALGGGRSWPLYQAFVIGGLGALSALFAMFAIFMSSQSTGSDRVISGRGLVALQSIAACLAVVVTAYLALRVMRRNRPKDFWGSIHWRADKLVVAACAGLGLLSSLFIRYFLVRNFMIGPPVSAALNDRIFLYVVLGTVVLQPFVEEVYFRGILFEALSFRIGQLASIGIVTAIFVLMHIQHQWIVLPVALVLAVTRLATRSTASCFALHAAYNLGVIMWGLS